MAQLKFAVHLTPQADAAEGCGRLTPMQQDHIWRALGAAAVKATAMCSTGTYVPPDPQQRWTVECVSFHVERSESALNLTTV